MPEETFEDYRVLEPIRDKNAGWLILPIPYWSDPEKQKGSEWERTQRALYDREEDFAREMLCDFSAQLGVVAFPSFSPRIHVVDEPIKAIENLPLCLACDFNLDPLIMEVCQIRGGMLFIIDEICLSPGTIDKATQKFRDLYPNHPGGIHIYGDSNGLRKNVQTGRSEYDLIVLGLAGYPSDVELRVPRAHPNPRDRINALNRKFKGHEDIPGITVFRDCQEFIDDCQQVVLRPDGKDVLKIYKPTNPYHQRTHASDAVSYLVWREWPVRKEVLAMKMKGRSRAPLVYGDLIGSYK